jgi:undecaprenyl pyrophosphate synthase
MTEADELRRAGLITRSDLVRWLRREAEAYFADYEWSENSRTALIDKSKSRCCRDLAARIEGGEKIGGDDER